jgi:hypothetical protein
VSARTKATATAGFAWFSVIVFLAVLGGAITAFWGAIVDAWEDF